MKIFISWSGEKSRRCAELVKHWLKSVVQATNPWFSEDSIEPGTLWFTGICKELQESRFGIICLTKENLVKPWVLFEAGALAKELTTTNLYVILVDLESSEVRDPLGQLNHTKPNKDDMKRLVASINAHLRENGLTVDMLNSVFEVYWPIFETQFAEIADIPEPSPSPTPPPPVQDEYLAELLATMRSMNARMGQLESAMMQSVSASQATMSVADETTTERESYVNGMMGEATTVHELERAIRQRRASGRAVSSSTLVRHAKRIGLSRNEACAMARRLGISHFGVIRLWEVTTVL